MKIYVATKTHNWRRARSVMELCRRAGHEITWDWTRTVEAVGDAGLTEGTIDPATRRQCAKADRGGVVAADLLIVLDYEDLCGTLIELGVALGINHHRLSTESTRRAIDIWLVGFHLHDSVFFDLPECVHVEETELPTRVKHLTASMVFPGGN